MLELGKVLAGEGTSCAVPGIGDDRGYPLNPLYLECLSFLCLIFDIFQALRRLYRSMMLVVFDMWQWLFPQRYCSLVLGSARGEWFC